MPSTPLQRTVTFFGSSTCPLFLFHLYKKKKNTAIVRNTNYRKKNKMMFIQKPTEIC
jgi:hypothetical protein